MTNTKFLLSSPSKVLGKYDRFPIVTSHENPASSQIFVSSNRIFCYRQCFIFQKNTLWILMYNGAIFKSAVEQETCVPVFVYQDSYGNNVSSLQELVLESTSDFVFVFRIEWRPCQPNRVDNQGQTGKAHSLNIEERQYGS